MQPANLPYTLNLAYLATQIIQYQYINIYMIINVIKYAQIIHIIQYNYKIIQIIYIHVMIVIIIVNNVMIIIIIVYNVIYHIIYINIKLLIII